MTSSCQRSACRTGLRPQQLGWIIVAHRPPREECCGNLICPEFARERSTLRLGRCRPHGTQYRLVIPLGNTDHQAPHMPLVLASSTYPFPPLVNPSTWFTYSCQRILLLHTLARLEAYGIYFSLSRLLLITFPCLGVLLESIGLVKPRATAKFKPLPSPVSIVPRPRT